MADRINAYYWVLFEEAKEHIILEWYDGSWLQGLSELDEHQLSQIKEVIEEPVEYKPTKQRKDGYYWVCFKFQKNRESWHVCEWRNGRWVDDGQVNFSLIDRVMEQPIKDNVLALEKDIDKDYLTNGYFLKASDKNTYLVVINDIKAFQKVIVHCRELDKNFIDEGIDLSNLKNGQKVSFDKTSHSKLLELELYQKYFLPYFFGAPQWSHEHDLEDFTFLIKNAYALALEVSGLETY